MIGSTHDIITNLEGCAQLQSGVVKTVGYDDNVYLQQHDQPWRACQHWGIWRGLPGLILPTLRGLLQHPQGGMTINIRGVYRPTQCEITNTQGMSRSTQCEITNTQGVFRSTQWEIINTLGISRSSQGEITNTQGMSGSTQCEITNTQGMSRSSQCEIPTLRVCPGLPSVK